LMLGSALGSAPSALRARAFTNTIRPLRSATTSAVSIVSRSPATSPLENPAVLRGSASGGFTIVPLMACVRGPPIGYRKNFSLYRCSPYSQTPTRLSMVKAFHLHIWGSPVARKVIFVDHVISLSFAFLPNLLCQ